MTPSSAGTPADGQLAGRDVLQILWRGRVSLIIITLGITLAVTAASFLLTKKYEATVTMMPVPDSEAEEKSSGMGATGSALGGLASLAGLSSSGGDLKVEGMAILESEALTERYIRDNNLLPVLYSSKWDPVRKQWKVTDPQKIPTLWRANRLFRGIRKVTDNLKNGTVTLKITWKDPYQAAKWANDLVALTNEDMRSRTVAEAERNIAFLEEEEGKNSLVSMHQAAAMLTESQLRKVMLAKGREQYAMKILDPATPSERPSFPIPSIWIPAGFFGGLFLAVLFVLLRASGPPAA